MISGDWGNMCQAVWRSPLLPVSSNEKGKSHSVINTGVGTGHRFKRDLLAYLGAYGNKKTGPLVKQLERHDFGAIRAALIASVPSKQEIAILDSEKESIWGWPALKDTLCHVPLKRSERESDSQKAKPRIVIQVRTYSKKHSHLICFI
jgi:tyrosyl-DNA phosphodiesterase-1